VRELIDTRAVTAVHDCADGGVMVAVAEMALAANIGVHLDIPALPNLAAILFGEDQGRYVVATRDPESVLAAAKDAGVFVMALGVTDGDTITGPDFSLALSDLRAAHDSFFKNWMES